MTAAVCPTMLVSALREWDRKLEFLCAGRVVKPLALLSYSDVVLSVEQCAASRKYKYRRVRVEDGFRVDVSYEEGGESKSVSFRVETKDNGKRDPTFTVIRSSAGETDRKSSTIFTKDSKQVCFDKIAALFPPKTTSGDAVKVPSVPVVATSLGQADVERYLEEVLRDCKSRSKLLHSIEIESASTGKKFTVTYRYTQKSSKRPTYDKTPIFTVDAPKAGAGCVVVCKERFENDRSLAIPETFTEKDCKAALYKFAGVSYGVRPP
jgi:hypothetical protein